MELTDNQIRARIVVYNELIDHLDQSIYDNAHEQEQGAFLQKQLIRTRDRFMFMNRDRLKNYLNNQTPQP